MIILDKWAKLIINNLSFRFPDPVLAFVARIVGGAENALAQFYSKRFQGKEVEPFRNPVGIGG